MESLRACLFGFPQITLNGEAIQPERRKVLALLVYLFFDGEAHSRESLVSLFWPDQDAQQGFAYLRHALWEIRRLLGEEWLDLAGKTVRLRLEQDAWVDTRRFESLLEMKEAEAQMLQEAVDLYRGDFLAGFTLRDVLDFDDWQTARAEELRHLYDTALEKLVKLYLSGGELDTAVATARRRVDHDPLNEEAQRMLIELLARSGQRSAALHQYELCQRLLKDELGVDPEPETLLVYRRVCSGEFAPVKTPEPVLPVKPAPARIFSGGNLPAATGTFVGRVDELQQLGEILADPGCRLLTIIGPGGAGKTCLALEIARTKESLFQDGVWFIPLAPLRTPEGILPLMAELLHIARPGLGSRSSGRDLMAQISEFLHGRKLLLVMDNLEHLLEGATLLRDLVNAAPGVKILATSRERLNLPGEWVLEIAGLSVPGFHSSGRIDDYEAVQLFLSAARRASVGFKPAQDDWSAIGRICQQVDGLPLGLELAASWVRVLSCSDIAGEMERTLDFLYSSQRGVAERQRSLRTAFDYSWSLLSESERAAFRRLAVFEGGFDRQAASQIARVPLPVLTSLVDKSLLHRDETGRFELHQVLKRYALERLNENADEYQQVRDWHSNYYLDRMSDYLEELKGSQQYQVIQTIGREQPNLLAAWNWAIERQNMDSINRAVVGLALIFIMRGQARDDLEVFKSAMSLARKHGDKALLVFLLAVQFYNFSGIPAKQEPYMKESLNLLSQIADSPLKAYAQILLSTNPMLEILPMLQHLELCQRSAEYLHATGDDWGAGIATLVLADILNLAMRSFDVAASTYRRSLEYFSAKSNDWGRGLCLSGLAYVACGKQDYEQACQLFDECCSIFERLGDHFRIIRTRYSLAQAFLEGGEREKARAYLEANLPMLEEMGWEDAVTEHCQLLQKAAGSV